MLAKLLIHTDRDLFRSHLHLPAAEPFFSLSPADVVRISSLESHSGDWPPPQPPSLTLHIHLHRQRLLHYHSQICLYCQRCFSSFFGSKKHQKQGSDWFSHLSGGVAVSVIWLVCRRRKVTGNGPFVQI